MHRFRQLYFVLRRVLHSHIFASTKSPSSASFKAKYYYFREIIIISWCQLSLAEKRESYIFVSSTASLTFFSASYLSVSSSLPSFYLHDIRLRTCGNNFNWICRISLRCWLAVDVADLTPIESSMESSIESLIKNSNHSSFESSVETSMEISTGSGIESWMLSSIESSMESSSDSSPES